MINSASSVWFLFKMENLTGIINQNINCSLYDSDYTVYDYE